MVVWEALDALSHQFELCKIDADSRVAVLFDDAVDDDRAALIRAALARSGADTVELRPRTGSSPFLAEMAAAADLIVTTRPVADFDLRDDQQLLFLANCEPHAFPPHATMARRVRALDRELRSTAELTISDPHGTDVTIALADSAPSSDGGILSDQQPHASFPAGWVAAAPAHNTVNGELIIMPGDSNLNAQRMVSSPLRLQIVDDHVAAIEGDNPDADVLRALFEYAQQPSAYGVAGISIGMNPGCERADAFDPRLLDTHLARLLAGVVTVSFGENVLAGRPCDQTVTLALPGRTAHINGLPIVINGRLQGDFAPDVYEA